MDRRTVSCNTKKPWSLEEDERLLKLVTVHGTSNWTGIGEMLSDRTGKQCRERWHNHINPDIKKGEWSEEEDRLILSMQRTMGNQWAKITKFLPGRSDNAVKNRFHAIIRSRSSLPGAMGSEDVYAVAVPTQQPTLHATYVAPSAPHAPSSSSIPSSFAPASWMSAPAAAVKLEQSPESSKKLKKDDKMTSIFGFAPTFESLASSPLFGDWAPASGLVSLSQTHAMSYFPANPFYSQSMPPSQQQAGESPTPSLRSMSPISVDEEFLEVWMSTQSGDDQEEMVMEGEEVDVPREYQYLDQQQLAQRGLTATGSDYSFGF